MSGTRAPSGGDSLSNPEWRDRAVGTLRGLSSEMSPKEVNTALRSHVLGPWNGLHPAARADVAPWVWAQIDRLLHVSPEHPEGALAPAWDSAEGACVMRIPARLAEGAPPPLVRLLLHAGLIRLSHAPLFHGSGYHTIADAASQVWSQVGNTLTYRKECAHQRWFAEPHVFNLEAQVAWGRACWEAQVTWGLGVSGEYLDPSLRGLPQSDRPLDVTLFMIRAEEVTPEALAADADLSLLTGYAGADHRGPVLPPHFRTGGSTLQVGWSPVYGRKFARLIPPPEMVLGPPQPCLLERVWPEEPDPVVIPSGGPIRPPEDPPL